MKEMHPTTWVNTFHPLFPVQDDGNQFYLDEALSIGGREMDSMIAAAYDLGCLWTVIHSEGDIFEPIAIISGMRKVNRMGHIIAMKPCYEDVVVNVKGRLPCFA